MNVILNDAERRTVAEGLRLFRRRRGAYTLPLSAWMSDSEIDDLVEALEDGLPTVEEQIERGRPGARRDGPAPAQEETR